MEGLKQKDVSQAKVEAIKGLEAELEAKMEARKGVSLSEPGAWSRASDRVQEVRDRLYVAQHGERSDLGRVPEAMQRMEPRIHEVHRGFQEVAKARPDLGVKSPFTKEALKGLSPNAMERFLPPLGKALEGLRAPLREGRDPGQDAIKAVVEAIKVMGRVMQFGRDLGLGR